MRATRPDASGKFNLAYLPGGTYTVVITSDSRATGVVDSVPVGTSSVVLNGTSTAVVLPSSAMGTVTGTVSQSSTSGSATLVTDATVTALQSIGSQLVEIASTNVDFTSATYTLALPTAQPVRATYSGTALSSFAPTGTAGAYSLRSVSPTAGTKTVTTTVDGTATTTLNIAH